jgi:glycosyltransferase involved in cell wall biosynthesis
VSLRIAFDQQVFLLQEFGGISRYVCRLSEALSCSPAVEARIFAPLHYNGHLMGLPRRLVHGWRMPRIPKTARPTFALSALLARRAICRFHPHIVHETYYSKDAFAPKGARRVITVYDMISERFPFEFAGSYFTDAKRFAISRADHVLCISESTRRDLIELFGIAAERTSVVYLGYDEFAHPATDQGGVKVREGLRPYLLYVGSRGGYKNFAALLRAFASSAYLRDGFSILCFGGGPMVAEERALLRQLGLSEVHVRQVGGDDRMLAAMYMDAAAFVYPSLYEGFGIPPLEAMSMGCPVICSNATSIPEVVGDAGEYFNPVESEAIRVAIERVLQSNDRRRELVTKGHARRAMFSWERCASETHDVYRSIL